MTVLEVNYEGLVCPIFNFAGLSTGNLASQQHAYAATFPKKAAYQSLDKMKLLHDFGVPQAIMPPQPRPIFSFLHQLGFTGSVADCITSAYQHAPKALAMAYSASSTWVANAATVSASCDTADGKLHFTPANLVASPHRALEVSGTSALLEKLFPDKDKFVQHAPLPRLAAYGDEGAANHCRLSANQVDPGISVFVYGRSDTMQSAHGRRFTARQSLEASQAIARLHQLSTERTVFVQQAPEAIDKGVFHNDLLCMSHQNALICHRATFKDSDAVLDALQNMASWLRIIVLDDDIIDIDNAVASYFFNSQFVNVAHDKTLLLCPSACQSNAMALRAIEHVLAQPNLVSQVAFSDCEQSMRFGGGPACCRLRVPMTAQERSAAFQGVFFTDQRYEQLQAWVACYYPERITFQDLGNPSLYTTTLEAMAKLADILGLDDWYASWQQTASST